jgi:transposase InsO family protein
MATAHQYHSDLKSEYLNGKLTPDIVKTIPRSTRQRWRNKDNRSFWMPVPIEHNIEDGLKILKLTAENKRLKARIRALYYIVMFYKQLVGLLPIKSNQVLKLKDAVHLILKFCLAQGFDKKVWRFLPFSFRQWHSWEGLKECQHSLNGYCRRQNVFQISVQEQIDLKNGCDQKEIRNWPLISVYYYLLRQKMISFSIGAFYKYCRLLKITKKKHKRRKKYTPLKATKPLIILHQDITIFKTFNGVKQYVYLIKDNFSRAILGYTVASEYRSEIAGRTFLSVLRNFGLMEKEGIVVTDGGMENKGEFDKMLEKPGMKWKRLTAQIDIDHSNSMIEATNKILKYRYLYPKVIPTIFELREEIRKAVEEFNDMPNGQLFGFTPNEVLEGAMPSRDVYKEQIYSATRKRMLENQTFNCNLHCRF